MQIWADMSHSEQLDIQCWIYEGTWCLFDGRPVPRSGTTTPKETLDIMKQITSRTMVLLSGEKQCVLRWQEQRNTQQAVRVSQWEIDSYDAMDAENDAE